MCKHKIIYIYQRLKMKFTEVEKMDQKLNLVIFTTLAKRQTKTNYTSLGAPVKADEPANVN